jgi:hypothetical protein
MFPAQPQHRRNHDDADDNLLMETAAAQDAGRRGQGDDAHGCAVLAVDRPRLPCRTVARQWP